MDFSLANAKTNHSLIVLPFWENKKGPVKAADLGKLDQPINAVLSTGDFQGKEGEVIFLYPEKSQIAKRLVLLGLGSDSKINKEKLRRAYSSLTRACHQKKIQEITLHLPVVTALSEDCVLSGVVEGILLSNYAFNELKGKKKDEPNQLIQKVYLEGSSKQALKIVEEKKIEAEGVYLTRDLVNRNSDDVTPQYLAKVAKDLSSKFSKIKTTILGKEQIKKEKMGLLLAVNRASDKDPTLIILSYKGNPKSKEHTVLVGKGITYDTGGLNLKPCASMDTMKADMAGGAAVIGTLRSVAALDLKVNVTAVIPATENSIGSKSFKPGDVYQSAKGITVEVNNPDAEGRLVLADAFTYVIKNLKPTRIVDLATLTGAVDVALGSEASGLFSNDDVLADSLMRAGANTFERLWRLPLYEEYKDSLKSDVADMKNAGSRSAGSITAAIFLQEFVDDVSWAHLDIASTAFLSDKKRYHPKFATGFGVRLLIDFLKNNS
jgi:leucyl aminopeptidase